MCGIAPFLIQAHGLIAVLHNLFWLGPYLKRPHSSWACIMGCIFIYLEIQTFLNSLFHSFIHRSFNLMLASSSGSGFYSVTLLISCSLQFPFSPHKFSPFVAIALAPSHTYSLNFNAPNSDFSFHLISPEP